MDRDAFMVGIRDKWLARCEAQSDRLGNRRGITRGREFVSFLSGALNAALITGSLSEAEVGAIAFVAMIEGENMLEKLEVKNV